MTILSPGTLAWLHTLHVVAMVSLRVRPPRRAKIIVDRLGRRARPLSSPEEAKAAVRALFPRGTCLSRALAVAALFRGAKVVLGVESSAPMKAHAWIEIGGFRLNTDPREDATFPPELARLA